MKSQFRPRAVCVSLIAECIVLFSSLLLLVTANADELPRSGTFEGQWTVVGEVQELEFADDRRIYIVRYEGNVKFDSSGGLPRSMYSDCLGFGDSKTRGLTRCKWSIPMASTSIAS